MNMEYGIYSDFSIERHKQTFIHYLEIIIDKNGKVMYAVPSHQEKMIKLACKKLNITRDKLNEMCPEEYYCDFMVWLSMVSGTCAVWENQVIGDKFTAEQIKALQMLKNEGLYLGEIPKIFLS